MTDSDFDGLRLSTSEDPKDYEVASGEYGTCLIALNVRSSVIAARIALDCTTSLCADCVAKVAANSLWNWKLKQSNPNERGFESKLRIALNTGTSRPMSLGDHQGTDWEELAPLLDAYRELRIRHQLNYANYKLRNDYQIFSDAARRQLRVLETVSISGIVTLFFAHILIAAGVALNVPFAALWYRTFST